MNDEEFKAEVLRLLLEISGKLDLLKEINDNLSLIYTK
jgi:hypothetical protein